MKRYALWLLLLLVQFSFGCGGVYARSGDTFLDALSTQFNVGFTRMDSRDRTRNAYIANSQTTLNFKGEGLHGAILILDEMQFEGPWYIGARAGAEFWSNLSGNASIASRFEGYTSRYTYRKSYGFFVDATLDLEIFKDCFDIYGFVGAGLDLYRLEGVNVSAASGSIIFRNSKGWLTNPRAGIGLSYAFKERYTFGIEYTHVFRNTLNFPVRGGNLVLDNRNHQIRSDDNTIDFTISVYMNS